MNKLLLYFSIFTLAAFACVVPTAPASIPILSGAASFEVSSVPSAPVPVTWTVAIVYDQVNIRNMSGSVLRVAVKGTVYKAWCDRLWCYLPNGEKVWRGCVDKAIVEICQ